MGKMKKFRKELDGFGGMFDDPCLAIFEDGKKKKKKKKKDKDKAETSGMSKKERNAEEAYIESLKVLDKKELARKLERFGGTVESGMSRKDMIKAIVKLRRKAIDRDKVSIGKPSESPSMNSAALQMMDRVDVTAVSDEPPFYFDEASRSFVINRADTAPDTEVYAAVRGLGAIRRAVRPDDGFAELMERIHRSITSPGYDPAAIDKPIIDVEFKVVDEEPVRKELPMAGLVEPVPMVQDAVELSDEDLSKLSNNIDNALNALNASASAGDVVKEKLPKKKGKKG